MAYEGVSNYCHSAYDWSIAKENPSIMYVQMGEETDSAYQVVFRSYTGAFVNFYVDKATGTTRMEERTNNMKYVKLIFRLLLGAFMTYAGFSHLTFNRQEFVAQVPTWLQFSPGFTDFVVLASGVVEIAFGLGIIFLVAKKRAIAGALLALFYVAIFPGNINQYVNHIDAFGLNTDNLRLIRLFFQPVLIFLALWTTGGWKYWRLWAKGKFKE